MSRPKGLTPMKFDFSPEAQRRFDEQMRDQAAAVFLDMRPEEVDSLASGIEHLLERMLEKYPVEQVEAMSGQLLYEVVGVLIEERIAQKAG